MLLTHLKTRVKLKIHSYYRMVRKLDEDNFKNLCDLLGKQDPRLKSISDRYGYPPFWSRKPGFETLIHIILEQQVSLASAKAALIKLQSRLGTITPPKLVALSDEELKACYFSRQKILYARHLATVIISKQLDLKKLESKTDDDVRASLKALPGIGNWTVDIYLMMALNRPDCFPLGDIALINSLKQIKNLPKETSSEELNVITNDWKPYRTVAAYLLWHSYLSKRAERKLSALSVQPSANRGIHNS
jgi:DNA-3-methyladenine glycosylase II